MGGRGPYQPEEQGFGQETEISVSGHSLKRPGVLVSSSLREPNVSMVNSSCHVLFFFSHDCLNCLFLCRVAQLKRAAITGDEATFDSKSSSAYNIHT